MSGALTALSAVSGIAAQALPQVLTGGLGQQLAFLRQPRQIGPAQSGGPTAPPQPGDAPQGGNWSLASGNFIVPDVTIEENFSDRVTVTQHPLATGSPLNDHAFRMPRTVTMKLGFTNANPIGALTGGIMSGLTSPTGSIGDALLSGGKGLWSSITESRAKDIYQKLLDLQFNPKAGTTGSTGKAPVEPMQLTTGKRTYDNMVITELTVRNDAKTEYALIIDVHFQEVITAQATVTKEPTQGNQGMPQKTDGTANGGTKNPAPVQPWWVRQNQGIFGPFLGNEPFRPAQ